MCRSALDGSAGNEYMYANLEVLAELLKAIREIYPYGFLKYWVVWLGNGHFFLFIVENFQKYYLY